MYFVLSIMACGDQCVILPFKSVIFMSPFHKILFSILFAVTGFSTLGAQKNYFQQEVNYRINVTLDDRTHTLTGDIAFEYINHAPEQLTEIWVHVWPNAFKNKRSAYCKQTLRAGSGKFYFAPDSSLGNITLLDFTVNGDKIKWKYDPANPDIALLTLSQPLPPEGRITIATPFKVKIPASFSRLGHVGTSYQITQWFPKPAVYDIEGWHAMPYLNQGEFYSEFGSFDVSITLPDNYVVGATGSLQTASEIAFLTQKEAETKTALANMPEETVKTKKRKKGSEESDVFPVSSTTMKTIRYKAERVHDFAWFADKRFYVVKDTARMASGRTVDCWGMFTKSDFRHWKKGAFYVKRSVEFYAEQVGEYPWPQATAVHSALSAGGGMEYPMITVIGNSNSDKSLDEVITHEVGHNWFYGLLASNERDHPWMDEGMNSYYEQRYMRQYYGSGSMESSVPQKIYNPEVYGGLLENGLLLLAHNGEDSPGDGNADKMTNMAYGLQVYMKTAHCFRWFENAIGTDKFDAAMKAYYQSWHFKHPRPVDFYNSMKTSGIDATWLMDQMQTRKHVDPAIKNIKKDAQGNYTLTIQQRGQAEAPFSVSAIKKGNPVSSKWFTPAPGQTTFNFGPADADAFCIDPEHFMLDYNRANNNIKTSGVFKKANPLKLRIVAPFEQPHHTTIGVLPWVSSNAYDRLMVGALLYNPPLSSRHLQYYLAPGFALNTKEFVGGGDIRYRMHPINGPVKRITLGINGRTFNDDQRGVEEKYYTRFYRVTPWVRAEFRSSNTAIRQSVQFRWNYIGQEAGFDTAGVKQPDFISNIWETKYKFSNLTLPNPYDLTLALEGQNWDDEGISHNYLRLGLEWKQQLYYQQKRKVSVRFYAGYFLKNTYRDRKTVGFGANDQTARGTLSLAQNGYTDYKYDYLYAGRNESSGLYGHQVNLAEGGFKYAFGGAYATSGDAGHSNNYLLALNLEADLPKKLPLGLPIKPYVDFGYADLGYLPSGGDEPKQFFASGGLVISLLKGNFNIYLPVASTQNINRLYQETSNGNYLRRITWSIKLDGLDPLEIADRFNK